MSSKKFILGLFLSCAPLAVLSLTLQECVGSPVMEHHVVEVDHQVLGQGVVTYLIVGGICSDDLGCTKTETVLISACGSGHTISASVKLDRDYDEMRFDHSMEVNELLRMLSTSETSYDLNEVKTAFENSGIPVDEEMKSVENCACAVAFPELRNGKQEFEGL